MNVEEMIEWLLLLRDKVDLEISKVSINTPLLEISAMITTKIRELQNAQQIGSRS